MTHSPFRLLANSFMPKPPSPFNGDWIQTTCMFHGGGFISPISRLGDRSSTYFFPVDALEVGILIGNKILHENIS